MGGFFVVEQSLLRQPLQPGESRTLEGLAPMFHRPFKYELRAGQSAVVVPIFCGGAAADPAANGKLPTRRVHVVIGHPLPADASPEVIRRHIRQLGRWLDDLQRMGETPITATIPQELP